MRVLPALILLFSFTLSGLAQDSTVVVTVGSVSFEGNKITKEAILYREMTVAIGDQIELGKLGRALERSRNNIRSLNIFNFVAVDTCLAGNQVDVVIRLVERWYVLPIPIIKYADRNLGEWIAQGWKIDRLDYGAEIWWTNFRGRNETLVLLAQFGYNNSFGFQYRFPYLDKNKKFGLDLEFFFTRNHEVAYGVEESKRVFHREPDEFARIQYEAATTLIYRPKLYDTHEFQIGYVDAWATDTIADLNPLYFNSGKTNARYFSLSYKLQHDKRDYNVYPLNGYQLGFEAVKNGLGIFEEAVNMLDLSFDYSQFWQLHNRWYAAGGLKVKTSLINTQSYFAQRGLGYEDDFVRGYELYVIDGQYYGLLKTNLRFQPVKDLLINLKFIKNDKFGLIPLSVFTSFHFDAGYVMDNVFKDNNPLANRFIAGAGFGVDLVTFYDVAWRLEYSFNDRLEHGFFIHFTKHI